MSRVGKEPVQILQGVQVQLHGKTLSVQGPKGKLTYVVPSGILMQVDRTEIKVIMDPQVPQPTTALQGMARTLVHNMVHGVHTGFKKELEIMGVGYRAATKGSSLLLTLGYSHPEGQTYDIEYALPQGISVKVENNTKLIVEGFDKVLVGMVAAKIRSFREPSPYQGKGNKQGKGIKYVDEKIAYKQGKAAGAK